MPNVTSCNMYTCTGTFITLSSASAMTDSVIDDFSSSRVAYQAYADSVLWRNEILSGILAATFLSA